jgi:hypothetical protein
MPITRPRSLQILLWAHEIIQSRDQFV